MSSLERAILEQNYLKMSFLRKELKKKKIEVLKKFPYSGLCSKILTKLNILGGELEVN